jgi:hypothetical protein
MFTILPTQIAAVAMAVLCGLALIVGRRFERGVAVVTVLAWVASAAVQDPDRAAVQWAIFAVDLVYLLVLISLSVFNRPVWILFMAAFQLLVVLTHVAFIIDLSLGQWGFFSAYYLWSDAQLVALAVGVFQAWRARQLPKA